MEGAAVSQSLAGPQRSQAVAADQCVRVLLIEDDEDDYILTRDLLAEIDRERFTLDWLDSFDAARDAIARQEYDVYLIDYRLGEHSGLELLREAERLGCQAPIIVLTGQGSRDIDLQAMRAGAAYYLAKAKIDAPLLERSIRYALELKSAQQSLRFSEGRLRAILENAVDGVITIDARGTIESFNPAAARMFGYRAEEVIGQSVTLLMPSPYRDEHQTYIARYLQTGEPHIIGIGRQVVGRRKGGTTFPLDLSVGEMKIDGQHKFIGIARDITESKRVEEQLRKANRTLRVLAACDAALAQATDERALLDAVCRAVVGVGEYRFVWVGFATADAEKTVQPVAHAGEDGGYLEATSITWADTDLGRGPTGTAIRTGAPCVVQHIATDPAFAPWREEALRRGYGSSVALPLIMDGRSTGALCIYAREADAFDGDELRLLEDLAGRLAFSIAALRGRVERHRAAEEIRQLNAELEQRVKERTAQLEAANKELEAFSYSVSHDLRAPLRAIDGFSRMILEDYLDRLDEKGRHYLARVRAGTQHMGQLIDDLLALSRVTRSEMHMETVDLSALVQSIAADLRKTQSERQVQFVIAPGVVAHGDVRLLRVALENLLGNAWKYTSKHPQGRIEFGLRQEGGQVIYFVRDDGAGFDPAFGDKLFGAFQRLHSTAEFEGTGIGLATVQRIIHRHGGRIWAESAVEQGATFSFTLPTK